jgi:hypothetical protein
MADIKFNKNKFTLDPATLTTLHRVREKYVYDYDTFISDVIRKLGKQNAGDLIYLRELVRQVIDDIDDVLAGKNIRNGKDVTVKIFNSMNDVTKGIADYKESVKDNGLIREKIEQAEKTTGVSFGDLEQTQETIGKGIKQVQRRQKTGVLDTLKAVSPSAFNFGKSAIGGIVNSALGPFAGMAKGVWGAGQEVGNFLKARKEERENRNLAKGLTPLSNAYSGEEFGAYDSLKRKTKMGPRVNEGTFGGQGLGRSTAKESFWDKASNFTAGLGKSGGEYQTANSAGNGGTDLFTFFNKTAYRARWTREVLDALKSMSGKGGGSGLGSGLGSGVGSFMGGALGSVVGAAVKAALLGLGLTGAVTALGAAVIAYNKVLDKLEKINPSLGKIVDAITHITPGLDTARHPLDRIKNMARQGGVRDEWLKEQHTMVDSFRELNKVLADEVKALLKIKGFFGKVGSETANVVLNPIKSMLGPSVLTAPNMSVPGVPGVSGASVGGSWDSSFPQGSEFLTMFSGYMDQMLEQMKKIGSGSSTTVVNQSDKGAAHRVGDSMIDQMQSGQTGSRYQ